MGLQLQHRAAKCFFVKLGDFSTEGANPLACTEIVELVEQLGHEGHQMESKGKVYTPQLGDEGIPTWDALTVGKDKEETKRRQD